MQSDSTSLVKEMEELRHKFGENWLKFQKAEESDTNFSQPEFTQSDTGNVEPLRLDFEEDLTFPLPVADESPEDFLDEEASGPTESGENESNPFLVKKVVQDGENELFITVGEVHVIERNTSAIIVEMLEIGSIQKAEIAKDSAAKLLIKFDYVHPDRRKRVYIFEDAVNAGEFLDIIQPLLESKSNKEINLECLQCKKVFAEFRARREIKYLTREEIKSGYSSSVGSASASIKGALLSFDVNKCPTELGEQNGGDL